MGHVAGSCFRRRLLVAAGRQLRSDDGHLIFMRISCSTCPLSDYKSRTVYKRLSKLSLNRRTKNATPFLWFIVDLHSVRRKRW